MTRRTDGRRARARLLAIGALPLAALLLAGCAGGESPDPNAPDSDRGAAGEGPEGDRSGQPSDPNDPAATGTPGASAGASASPAGSASAPFVDPDGDPLTTCATLLGINASDIGDTATWTVLTDDQQINSSILASDGGLSDASFPALADVFGDGADAIECKFHPTATPPHESIQLVGYAVLQPGEGDALGAAAAATADVKVEERDGRTIYTLPGMIYHQSPTVVSIGDGDVFWSEGKDAWEMAPDL